jgi:hypothetical protein
MSKKIFSLMIVFLLMSIQTLHAELFVHQLHHQPAANIIPVIQPHLSTETSITAKGFQLFVDGSKKDNQKVINILQTLDTKLKQYFIEVKILNHEMDRYQLNATNIKIANQSGEVKIKRHQTQNHQTNGDNYSLRTTENYQALVTTDETFPTNQVINQYGHLLPSSGKTTINSGFYITVQQTGPQIVALTVSAQQQNRQVNNNRSINSSSASTRVSGKLGKWLLVASNANHSSLGSSKRYTTNSKASKQRWYYIRVNELAGEKN